MLRVPQWSPEHLAWVGERDQRPAARRHVDAEVGQFVVEADGREVQRLTIKGIGVGSLPFVTFVDQLCAEARTIRMYR